MSNRLAKWYSPRKYTFKKSKELDLSSYGFSVLEIADKVHLTRATINSRRKRINNKMGTNNTTESVAMAIREGII